MQKKESQSDARFENPGSYYRGAPFWAWNGKLKKEQLKEQIGYFKEMGMGGFHMHSRTGLDTPYMEEEFLSMVKFCTEEAKRNDMYAYLYDEDRWPSGAAGGKVTKNEAYRSRYLVLTPISNEARRKGEANYDSSARADVSGKGTLLAAYRIVMEDGILKEYKRLDIDGELPQDCWYVYLETATASPWYNNQTYVDTLNPEAIREFIKETHEKYYDLLKEDFGKRVPSIFTDEPQFPHKTRIGRAQEECDIILPYTESFETRYTEQTGESFFDRLPEVVWETAGEDGHGVRYRYHELLAEQFAGAFADTLGEWCSAHGLWLTGHMMEEPTLCSQTAALGEAMRSYRSFQLPGIDMLCDRREYTTAKQAQSAAHQYGREGVLSELYGVTNWDFDFRRHKLQGDWQAALGVTRRVPHLSWMSMAGEAKRDYPASIFYQSPWYREYRLLEDHYARLNTVLMRGEPIVKIGVVHPIESYWLHYGPREQNGVVCQEMEDRFENLTQWLLFGHFDFDFIAESLLPGQVQECDGPVLKVGEMEYDVVIVPGCETLRRTTLAALDGFANRGGRVIVMGDMPVCLDGMPDAEAGKLADIARRIPFSRGALCSAMEEFATVRIRNREGEEAGSWIYQMRRCDGDLWLFIANGREQCNPDVGRCEELEVLVPGGYDVLLYDTLTGRIGRVPCERTSGRTVIRLTAWEHDSFLLRLCRNTAESACVETKEGSQKREAAAERDLEQPAAFFLSEPNVLLLDAACWRLDGGEWQEREEILLLDDRIREKLGYPRRMDAVAQPWTVEKKAPEHVVELKFEIESETEVADAELALEYRDGWQIFVDNAPLAAKIQGYFVDECIKRVRLPGLAAGRTEILLRIPYGEKTDLEWCYLLGTFGVRLAGDTGIVTPKPEKLYFGDYTGQGFPFFAGNVEYICRTHTEAGQYGIRITKFRSPLLRVWVDGRDCGPVMFAPYETALGHLEEGEHEICIRSYGNRANAFGMVHNCNEQLSWGGPNAWRTTGEEYAKEYQLKRMGILKAPVLVRYREQ